MNTIKAIVDTVCTLVYAPMEPFRWHPERAYFVAIVYLVLLAVALLRAGAFRPRVHILILSATVLWLLYGLNETQATIKGWSHNIRGDLVLFDPLIMLFSILAAWWGVRMIITHESKK